MENSLASFPNGVKQGHTSFLVHRRHMLGSFPSAAKIALPTLLLLSVISSRVTWVAVRVGLQPLSTSAALNDAHLVRWQLLVILLHDGVDVCGHFADHCDDDVLRGSNSKVDTCIVAE